MQDKLESIQLENYFGFLVDLIGLAFVGLTDGAITGALVIGELVGLVDGEAIGKFVIGVFVILIVGVLVGILVFGVPVGLIDGGVFEGTEVTGVPDGAKVELSLINVDRVGVSKSYISTKLISQYASVNSDGF